HAGRPHGFRLAELPDDGAETEEEFFGEEQVVTELIARGEHGTDQPPVGRPGRIATRREVVKRRVDQYLRSVRQAAAMIGTTRICVGDTDLHVISSLVAVSCA